MSELYTSGYNAFYTDESLSDEFLKMQPYQFRVGYQRAKQDYESNTDNLSLPLVIQQVNRQKPSANISYNDIIQVTKRPYTIALHHPQLRPVLSLLVRSIEDNIDQVPTYMELIRVVERGFNIILQYGYDEGVLDLDDLKQYGYKPR